MTHYDIIHVRTRDFALARDHAEALCMNVQFDVERAAERIRQHIEAERDAGEKESQDEQ